MQSTRSSCRKIAKIPFPRILGKTQIGVPHEILRSCHLELQVSICHHLGVAADPIIISRCNLEVSGMIRGMVDNNSVPSESGQSRKIATGSKQR